MPHIYKIATHNVNAMATEPRITMLEDFLKKQEIDIILLQEIKISEALWRTPI
jgi:exonuclease III